MQQHRFLHCPLLSCPIIVPVFFYHFYLSTQTSLSETILLSNSTLNILSVTDVTVITRLVSQPLQLFYLQSRLQVCWSTAWLWPLTSSQRCQAKALQLTIFTIESIDNACIYPAVYKTQASIRSWEKLQNSQRLKASKHLNLMINESFNRFLLLKG